MVFPGSGSHSPLAQSRSSRWAISAGVSCWSGRVTISRTGSGMWVLASSLTFSAMALKMSQSLLDSQQGGTAACRGWMNECMSVELRSSFSYQVAAGRMTSL